MSNISNDEESAIPLKYSKEIEEFFGEYINEGVIQCKYSLFTSKLNSLLDFLKNNDKIEKKDKKQNKQKNITDKVDKRKTNRLREDERVDFLCDSINNRTPFGVELKTTYYKKLNKEIDYVEKTNQNQSHFDIVIYHTDKTKNRCEEKGTETLLSCDKLELGNPWDNSVQRFNGPGNKFSIGLEYAKAWYNIVLKENGEHLRSEYNITAKIPEIDTWLEKDAFACGDPVTEFGIELKKNYREKHPKTSMNGKNGSPKDYRELVNKQFVEDFNKKKAEVLIKEVQSILNNIMNEKDCWLKTSGNIKNDKLTFCWVNKIKPPKITGVEISWNKGADIYFNFKGDELNDFKCILRFGKGTGFSNIRFDIR